MSTAPTSAMDRLKRVHADPISCRSDSDPAYVVRGADLAKALAVIEAAKKVTEAFAACEDVAGWSSIATDLENAIEALTTKDSP